MKQRRPMYGEKRDYPKIELYVNGHYVGTTTWAWSIRFARERYAAVTGITLKSITANYKE